LKSRNETVRNSPNSTEAQSTEKAGDVWKLSDKETQSINDKKDGSGSGLQAFDWATLILFGILLLVAISSILRYRFCPSRQDRERDRIKMEGRKLSDSPESETTVNY
jgi:hypothetical protein